MHARWISALYDYLCDQKEIILNGFKAAGITEAVESASAKSIYKIRKIHLNEHCFTFRFVFVICFKKKCLYCVVFVRIGSKIVTFC